MSWLDETIPDRFADEMSTCDVIEDHDVPGYGQVALVEIAGQDPMWRARSPWYVSWGDIPGRMMGWSARAFWTKEAAIAALEAERGR
jgi:hypothetical protein